MKPDRSNYEIWLIDWLDGKLSDQQREELMVFLESNPDIREEAESMTDSRVVPPDHPFRLKQELQRTPADLSPSQVEYLAAAYLEGDISPEEEADLKLNLAVNSESQKIFEAIQKTKLSAPYVVYANKNSLVKTVFFTGTLRISVSMLSAAAIIILLILNHFFIPRTGKEISQITQSVATLTIERTQPYMASDRVVTEYSVAKSNVKTEETFLQAKDKGQTETVTVVPDSSSGFERAVAPGYIAFYNTPSISADEKITLRSQLIESPVQPVQAETVDDDQSRLSKFIAKTFRAKILRQDKVSEEPLRSYEIAEAGIDGLNKLLGWQMALVKTNDESGQLKSLYFSSKLVKFNAPVRKTSEVK
jgi:hypothetical protein